MCFSVQINIANFYCEYLDVTKNMEENVIYILNAGT